MAALTGYIGTYAGSRSAGIYRFDFDPATGALSRPSLFYEAEDAKCVALSGGLLAATLRRGAKAGVCLLDPGRAGSPLLAESLPETVTACFIDHRADAIMTANYHEGTVLIYERAGGKLKPVRALELGREAGCHQVLCHAGLLLVPCLELDEVRLFDAARGFAPAGAIPFPPGSGPRHGHFSPDGKRLYLVTERSNELFPFLAGPGARFTPKPPLPLLPRTADGESAAAALRLSPDGQFLYVSVRGADQLSVFRLRAGRPEPLQQCSCGGSHPRDFLIAPDGRHLLVVNRTSNDLVSFALDPRTGLIGARKARVPVHQGVGLALVEPQPI